jgi:hypothetical protein
MRMNDSQLAVTARLQLQPAALNKHGGYETVGILSNLFVVKNTCNVRDYIMHWHPTILKEIHCYVQPDAKRNELKNEEKGEKQDSQEIAAAGTLRKTLKWSTTPPWHNSQTISS